MTRAIARLGRCPQVFVDPFAFFEFFYFLERTTPFLDENQSCFFRVFFLMKFRRKKNRITIFRALR